jgi:tetratricopeptide (TPR) repeat protein
MRLGSRTTALGLTTLVPVVAIAVTIARGSRPVPTLEQVTDLARSGRFDEAEARGSEYLGAFPLDPSARLIMAEIALSRPRPDPQRALQALEQIPLGSSPLAPWVLVDKGNAYHLLGRFDEAEKCWNEALTRAPAMLEAARRLLDLFGLQGRLDEAHELVYRQLEHQSDPRERLTLLLRLTRLDVDPPDPRLVADTFEPAVRAGTADLPTTTACGLAQVELSRSEDGLPMLRLAAKEHPDSARCWDALLSGLEHAGQRQEVSDVLMRLPVSLADDARTARHRGWIAQEAGRWSDAAGFYRRAWEHQRDNTVGYRLRRTLALAGQVEAAKQADRVVLDYREAFKQARAAIDEANALLQAEKPLPAEFPALMAALRRRMGRDKEAEAWQRLQTGAALGARKS